MEEQFDHLDPHKNPNISKEPKTVIQQLEQFMSHPFTLRFPNALLDKSNWRINIIRQDLIGLYVLTHQYSKAVELLIEQMKCEELIYPKYHNQKLVALRTYFFAFDKLSKEEQIKYSKLAAECLNWNVYQKIETIFSNEKSDQMSTLSNKE
jgi:hypothetical protein